MNDIKWLIILLLAALCLPNASEASPVEANVNRNQIDLGESLQLEVSVNGSGDVDISPIKDFRIVSQGTSTSVNIVNGSMTRETRYSFTLIPLKEGALKIPPLSVVMDGRTYLTNDIAIQVSKSGSTQQDSPDRDIFVEATLSNPNPYEGEQIIYTFRFYFSVQLANDLRFQKPEFSGFTSKVIEDNLSNRKVIQGKRYEVREVNYILIPLQAGEKTIEPAMLECDIVVRSSGRQPFSPFFGNVQVEPRRIQTEAIVVRVKPLPAYTESNKFSGLVGKFAIRAEIESDKLPVGDSTTLSIILEGKGNIIDAEEPDVQVPDVFKSYKDTPGEEIRVGKDGYSGKKVFRIALVPMKDGTHTIAPVRYTYFDVEKGAYQMLETSPIVMHIDPAEHQDKLEVYSAPQPGMIELKKKVEFTGRDILPLKEELSALDHQSELSWIGFVILIAVPVIFFIGIKTTLRFRKDETPETIMTQRAEQALKDACNAETGREEFLSCVHRALISALLSKAGSIGESLTYTEVSDILKSGKYPDDLTNQAVALLEKIESARFGGLNSEVASKDALLSEVHSFIRSLAR